MQIFKYAQRFALAVTIAIAGLVATGSAAVAADPQITLNSGGGTSTTDGIQVVYQGGQWQVIRQGSGQLYRDNDLPASGDMFNGVYLGLSEGGAGVSVSPATLVGHSSLDAGFTEQGWDSVSTTGSSSAGSGSFTSDLSVEVGGLTYVVHVTASYVYPADYFTLSFTVDIPAGNTKTVRLYTPYDSYLGGTDEGAGYYEAGPPTVVGVLGDDAVEAVRRVSGPAWAGYASEYFSNVVFSTDSYGPGYGTDLADVINPDPATDNGFGVNWNLGTSAGTTEAMTYLFMFSAAGVPDPPTDVTVTPGPEDGEVTVGWTPPASGPAPEGYDVVGLPEGACTAVAPATSCVVSGLTPGQEYTFTVVSTSSLGSGFPSATSAAVDPVVGPNSGKGKQMPLNGCVKKPKKIPSSGKRVLTKANCVTNAGNKVKTKVSCELASRGDVKYCKVKRKNGKVKIRTYGQELKIKVTWKKV